MIDYLLKFVLLFAAYYISAKIGLSFDAVSGFATLVWAPTGIALAALLLFGFKFWPAIFLAAFLVNLFTGAPPLVAVGMGVGNTLEAVIATYLIKKFTSINTFLDHLKDVFILIFLAALFSTAISATIGVASLYLGGVVPDTKLVDTWTAWWIGDMLGDLIVVPLIIVWSRVSLPVLNIKNVLELLALLLIVTFADLFIFLRLFTDELYFIVPRLYYIFPILLWAAVRFEKKAVTAVIAFTSLIAIIATVQGVGPFVQATSSLSAHLTNLQTFLAVVATMILSLSAVVSERKKAVKELQNVNLNLDQQVKKQTATLEEAQQIAHMGSFEWDITENKVTWSNELYHIFGLKPQEFAATLEAFLERLHPDSREIVKGEIEKALKSGDSFEFKENIIRPDKSVRTIHSKGNVVRDKDGKPLKLVGVCHDITEEIMVQNQISKKAEELERMNKLMVGRELKMIELKAELKKPKEK